MYAVEAFCALFQEVVLMEVFDVRSAKKIGRVIVF